MIIHKQEFFRFTQSRFFEAGGEGGWSLEEVVTMEDTECYLSPSF